MKTHLSTIQLPSRNESSLFSDMRGAHVALRAADYTGIVKWYKEKLDFRLIYQWPLDEKQLAFLAPANDDNFWIEIVGGGEDLQKINYTDFNESLNMAGYHHFCLDVDSVDKTLVELRIREVTIVSEAFDLPIIGKRIAFIADPYGNLIEVSENLK